ncbi:hypothetical protein [Actinoplanes sp. NPDC051411]|uniref:hypothetical protein n=1 Tax=Actinoplanes sp. NPDC051411 TaxID=3155522 RepID=UPI00341ACAA7
MTGADFGGVDIDLLADYIGGALTGTPEESVVAARIADDPAWQAAYESVGEGMALVTAELGRLAPEPMPADLADRLDTMLTGSTLLGIDTTPVDVVAPLRDTTPLGETPFGETALSQTPLGETSALRGADRPAALHPADTSNPADIRTPADAHSPADTHNAAHNAIDARNPIDARSPADARNGAHNPIDAHNPADAHNSAEARNLADASNVTSASDPADALARNSSDGGSDAVADPEPIAPDLAEPRVPHLHLVHGDLAGDDSAHGVQKTQPAPRRGRRLRWAAPIAVAAGLVAFVGFGLDYLAGRQSNSASTDSAAGSSEVRGEAPKLAPSAGFAQMLATGTDYTHDTLGIAPVQPMSGALTSPATPGRKTTPEMASGVESALQRLTSPTALADCLAAIEEANAGGRISPDSVDYARFDGAPAVIVRFTAGNGQWAWASGADCGTPPGDAATLDKVPVG